MKAEIHPKYHAEAQVTCSCGATFNVGSTMPSIEVEICSNCHPFYTGQEKIVDTAGRVEKFKTRQAKKTEATPKAKKSKSRSKTS